jgi:Tfp pilus assembly protein PilO
MLRSSLKTFLQTAWPRELLAGKPGKLLRVPAAVVLGLGTLNLLVYFFVLSPAAARLERQQVRYGELKRQYADAVLYRKQKKELAVLRAGAPAQKDIPLLIKDLVQTARRRNLSVGAINFDIPTPGSGGLTMISFSVPASGAYANAKRFIYDVETSDRLFGIRDLRLEADNGSVKLSMKLVTYIRGS